MSVEWEQPDAVFTPEEVRYCFHHEDVPTEIVDADFAAEPPPWRSATMPACAAVMTSARPVVAEEAAEIRVPVLIVAGDRDVVADPRGEATAYPNSPDITIATFEPMGHMHNFASGRAELWRRLSDWAFTVPTIETRMST